MATPEPDTTPAGPPPPKPRPLPSARRRAVLAVAVLAFVLWIGYLALLAGTTTADTVVLSRPQLLISNLIVIADVSGGEHPEAVVAVKEVIWADDPDLKTMTGKLTIVNLKSIGVGPSWTGPGEYILPLTQGADGWHVTPVPPSPGYPASIAQQAERVRIYLATHGVRRQLAEIVRRLHSE
jgi:hypothetical protein